MRVKLDQATSRRILVRVEDVPGFGWKAWRPQPLRDPVRVFEEDDGRLVLVNSLVKVVLSPADGTFSVNGMPGFNRLVDSGDHGDTYNYSPPEHDLLVDEPEWAAISLVESGPVRAIALAKRSYRWPEQIDHDGRVRSGEREVVVTSHLELRAGEPLVRVSTSFDNTCRDHRLRAWFPLPEPADRSRAECTFAVVERGLVAEGGPSERPLPTYPSRRFVQAGGLTVGHEGLCEYELVDLAQVGGSGPKAHGLALTLLRATGMLSRLTTLNRPLPAGPTDPAEAAEMQGHVAVRYAVAVGELDGYALADDAFTDLPVVASLGGGSLPLEGSMLAVAGAEVSAVRRVAGGALEVRVFNSGGSSTVVEVHGGSAGADGAPGPGAALRGQLVDLRGRHVGNFEGSFELGPFRIATVRLTRR